MYLVDTDVISEARKGKKADRGVQEFFRAASRDDIPLHLSAVTIGELRQGVEMIRHQGDVSQARGLERWLDNVTIRYAGSVLSFDQEAAQVSGETPRAAPGKPAGQGRLQPPP